MDFFFKTRPHARDNVQYTSTFTLHSRLPTPLVFHLRTRSDAVAASIAEGDGTIRAASANIRDRVSVLSEGKQKNKHKIREIKQRED